MHAHNKTQKTANENNGEKIGLYENKELTPSRSEATLKLHFSTDARKAMENKLFLIKKNYIQAQRHHRPSNRKGAAVLHRSIPQGERSKPMRKQLLKEKLSQFAQKLTIKVIALLAPLSPFSSDKEIQSYIHLSFQAALTQQKAALLFDKQQ